MIENTGIVSNTIILAKTRAPPRKWKGNLELVISEAKAIHGDKYDYSLLRADQIQSVRSRLNLPCNNCHKLYTPTLDAFILGKNGCPCYAGRLIWKGDLARLLSEAKAIHGDNYDYSLLRADQIENIESKLNLPCNNCHKLYTPTIRNFIYGQKGCPCYSNNVPIKGNLEYVLNQARAIHGDNYDYSRLKVHQILNVHSRLDLTCLKCENPYNPTIEQFIYWKHDCKCHTNRVLWKGDLNRFLREAQSIHGDKYDYSLITSAMIETNLSILELPCTNCHQIFRPTINDFINNKQGCPCYSCNGYSKKSIEWLNYISLSNNITIQHAKNGGEYTIPSTRYRVDGYHSETRTVYEFLGDYWHGNPHKYDSAMIHPLINDKTMGQLYTETMKRLQIIQSLGYTVVYIWESDWNIQRQQLTNNSN